MKSIISLVAATALLASSVSALQCGKGLGPKDNTCQPCDPGYYNDQDAGECKAAQPGWYACGSNSLTCYGATQQIQCGQGYYATGSGNSYCTICPAGSTCQSQTTDQPQPCVPGRYMPDAGSGASQCLECPAGTFNNENGATGCCDCCAGTFNDKTSQTHCYYCGEYTAYQDLYSPIGATSQSQCQQGTIRGITNAPKGTCDVTPPLGTGPDRGNCPWLQGTTPSRGPQQKRRHLQCGRGFKRCPLYTSIGGFDCVDIKNDPEQCGGCLPVEGVPKAFSGAAGQDCTAIPNASIANCVKGKCIVENCRKGFTKSADGKSCNSIHGLNVQEQHDTKRNTRGRRWHVSHSEN